MSQIVSLYETINQDNKVKCLWHNDHNPSLHVYNDGAKCYSCGIYVDIFSYVTKQENLSFLQAVKWIADREGILPEKVVTASSSEYRGPVPSIWITFWHSQLTPDKREYLHSRLLSDETIDSHMLGYDFEKDAYVLPFYRGYPDKSEVDIFQYRASPTKTWPVGVNPRRYWGKKSFNRPSVLGRHLINKELVIILFGSIDQLTAEQDGLPAISLSAIEGFSDPESEQTQELKRLLANTKKKIIVPDNTQSEWSAAFKLADILDAEVKFFGQGSSKDYNDYRLAGNTAQQFVEEILAMPEFLWFVDTDHVQRVFDILDEISVGHAEGALTILQVIVTEKKYNSSLVNRALQYACERQPFTNITFTPEEWLELANEFYECRNYLEMLPVISRWSEKSDMKQGAF
jgi:DNA primase